MTDTVLVTGATGFLGEALSDRLEEEGARVLRMSSSLGHDITEPGAYEGFRQSGIDLVCHLAARTFVPDAWANPASFYEVNTLGTQRALDFCRTVDARFLYCSAYVYGPPVRLPVDESHPVRPAHPYAHSKWLGEDLGRFYGQEWGLPVSIVRPFNVYGAGQDERFVIASIVGQWLRGERVRIATTTPKRDFLFIDDLVDALLAVVTGEPFAGETSNIGFGQSNSVGDVIATLGRVVGGEVAYEETGETRIDDIPDVVADCRLVRDGRWHPSTDLERGLEAMVRAAE